MEVLFQTNIDSAWKAIFFVGQKGDILDGKRRVRNDEGNHRDKKSVGNWNEGTPVKGDGVGIGVEVDGVKDNEDMAIIVSVGNEIREIIGVVRIDAGNLIQHSTEAGNSVGGLRVRQKRDIGVRKVEVDVKQTA